MVTRVTNSMLSRQLLSNLSVNLNNMDRLQNQLASGRKYAHISDDPAALIYGQAARNKLARLGHFQETVTTANNWLTQAESGVMELQKVIGNVYEELVNAGGPKTLSDRANIGMMINQLRQHYLDTLNSSYGDRFVFSGYNTPGDYVEGNAPTIKPFTLDKNEPPNLLFNGFNVSQFDGVPAAFFEVKSVPVGTERYNVSDLNPDNPDHTAAILELQTQWENHISNMRLRDLEGNDLGPMYPGGLADVYAAFGIGDGTVDGDGIEDGTKEFLKMHRLMGDVKKFDVGPGIEMPVTMNGLDLLFFTTQDSNGNPITRNMYELLNEVHDAVNGEDVYGKGTPVSVQDGDEIHGLTKLIKLMQDGQNHLLVKTAEIGGRTRRLELLEARYETDEINYGSMRSDAEDADIADVIMYMKMAEVVYQAALSAGSRVIQPTLMDFLR